MLSFGTAGCNLGCKFCQNWDISKSREIDTLADVGLAGIDRPRGQELSCRSVAFTYNDPVIFDEYAIDVANGCRERGIKTVAVTAGEVSPQPAGRFYALDGCRQRGPQGVHRRVLLTMFALAILAPVLDTLVYLKHETNVWFEITNAVDPGRQRLRR